MKRRLKDPISLLTPEDKALDSRFASDLERRWSRATPTLLQLAIDYVTTNLSSFSREAISELPRSIHAMLYEKRIQTPSAVISGTFRRFICHSLVSLSFSDFWYHDQEGLEETITLLESQAHGSLKTLDMRWFRRGPYPNQYPLCTNKHNQERRILASQPNIEKIVIVDQEILRLLPTHTPHLKSLEFFSHSGITLSDVNVITSLKDLTSLVLSWYQKHGTTNNEICKCEEEIMMFLENLPKLEELKTTCNSVHWGLLKYIEKYKQSCPLKLQYFETYSTDSDQISEIAKHLPDLNHLKLTNYQNFESLTALRRLGDVKLTKLEYTGKDTRGNTTENLTDDFSHFLTHAGEKLQSLSLMGGLFVVDLSEVGRFCPQISYIELVAVGVCEESKYDIDDQSFSKLKYFTIYNETKLPQAVLVHVLTRPSLERFFSFGVETHISTRVFEKVLDRARTNEGVFSNLQSLVFKESAGINIVMILELICLAPKLVDFNHDYMWERTTFETNAVRTMKKFLKRHDIRGSFF